MDISKPVIEQTKMLDVCYAEMKEDIVIYQKELWFNKIHVKADNKRLLFTDLTYIPNTDEKILFLW
ncbi:hypothetical protein HYN59_17670 [Flavobacterium album]|uniref:Uncharacterized protein n=1 Tax=Flavobacterium album TaxID=2175091 RepID=A0A2S1R2F1_9FLAO|nr:hypothetical protein HYN59_17670 [Flavobacterium album]